MIFIDDDNYLDHTKILININEETGYIKNINSISSKNKWLNIYEKLNVNYNVPIFPRYILGNIEE